MPLPTDYRYYVYEHLDEEGEVVYVGLGTSCRAFRATGSGHREECHKMWLEGQYNKGNIPTIFVENGMTKADAIILERSLIQHFRPVFNKIHNPNWKPKSKFQEETIEMAKNLRDMPYSYTQIAYLLGAESIVSRENKKAMTIWRMING